MNKYNENGEPHGYWVQTYETADGDEMSYSGHYDNGKLVGYWTFTWDSEKFIEKIFFV